MRDNRHNQATPCLFDVRTPVSLARIAQLSSQSPSGWLRLGHRCAMAQPPLAGKSPPLATEGVSKPESVAMFDYIINHTDDDDIVIFIKPRVMSLLASRRSSAYHMPAADSELWDYFDQIKATHLVVVENDAAFDGAEEPGRVKYLRDFAARNASKLTPVFKNADFRVHKINDRPVAAHQ
jgi:hypothetical protein